VPEGGVLLFVVEPDYWGRVPRAELAARGSRAFWSRLACSCCRRESLAPSGSWIPLWGRSFRRERGLFLCREMGLFLGTVHQDRDGALVRPAELAARANQALSSRPACSCCRPES